MHDYRSYTRSMLIIAGVAVLLIALLNFWSDSDSVFWFLRPGRIDSPRITSRDRISLTERYRALGGDCDTLVVGSSRMRYGLSSASPAWGEHRVYNLAIDGIAASELAEVINWATRIHLPKTCIIGLDQFMFLAVNRTRDNNAGTRLDPDLSYTEYYLSSLLGDAGNSWRNLGVTLRLTDINGVWSREGRRRDVARRIKYRPSESAGPVAGYCLSPHTNLVDENTFLPLWQAISRLQESNTRIILLVPPTQILRAYASHCAGEQEDIQRWYQLVVRLCQQLNTEHPGKQPVVLWNFAQCCLFEAEPLDPTLATGSHYWFYESSHMSQELGSLVISRVLGQPPTINLHPDELQAYATFGEQLTSSNIEAALARYERAYQAWLTANPREVRTYHEYICGPGKADPDTSMPSAALSIR